MVLIRQTAYTDTREAISYSEQPVPILLLADQVMISPKAETATTEFLATTALKISREQKDQMSSLATIGFAVESPEQAAQSAAQITANFDIALRRTSISGALDYAAQSIEDNAFDGLRRVIDVSGDGPNNMGDAVTNARDRVLARGMTINGLPLMTEDDSITSRYNIDDLDAYYTACVIGGSGAFVLHVTDWAEFEEAVRRKLVLEIASRPLPEQLWRAQSPTPYDCLIGEKIWERNQSLFAYP